MAAVSRRHARQRNHRVSRQGPFFADFDTFSSFFAHKIGDVIRGPMRLAR
jgi:hypothetical protein